MPLFPVDPTQLIGHGRSAAAPEPVAAPAPPPAAPKKAAAPPEPSPEA